MHFASIRIITDDPRTLVGFYERATGFDATWYTDDFAEVTTPTCTIAVGHTRTVALFAEGAATPAHNRSVIIEFLVEDVDREHERIAAMGAEVVQAPTTMPWGNRSLLFRDPDGNLVNLFTPVSPEARQRFAAVLA